MLLKVCSSKPLLDAGSALRQKVPWNWHLKLRGTLEQHSWRLVPTQQGPSLLAEVLTLWTNSLISSLWVPRSASWQPLQCRMLSVGKEKSPEEQSHVSRRGTNSQKGEKNHTSTPRVLWHGLQLMGFQIMKLFQWDVISRIKNREKDKTDPNQIVADSVLLCDASALMVCVCTQIRTPAYTCPLCMC